MSKKNTQDVPVKNIEVYKKELNARFENLLKVMNGRPSQNITTKINDEGHEVVCNVGKSYRTISTSNLQLAVDEFNVYIKKIMSEI